MGERITRREWIKWTAPALLSRNSTRADDSPRWIDAHTHVWTDDTERYSLAPGFSKRTMKPPHFTPEEFLAHASPEGVTRAVLIQMSYYGVDNSYMLDAIERHPGRFVGIAIIDADAAVPATMKQLKSRGVRGFRIAPGTSAPDRWLDGEGMALLWKTAATTGQAVCPLINPPHLPAVERMCQRFPETTVVVDHFARVGIDGTIREEELKALCRLARQPRAHVKTSAYYALGKKKAPYLDLLPMIRRVLDAFGIERCMWASDCPFQVEDGHRYRDSIALVRDHLGLSAAERSQILRGTAERLFFST